MITPQNLLYGALTLVALYLAYTLIVGIIGFAIKYLIYATILAAIIWFLYNKGFHRELRRTAQQLMRK